VESQIGAGYSKNEVVLRGMQGNGRAVEGPHIRVTGNKSGVLLRFAA